MHTDKHNAKPTTLPAIRKSFLSTIFLRKKNKKPSFAFIHRYGLEGWICCGGHAVPGIIEQLSETAEVHFYGPKSTEQKNASLRTSVRMHELPYSYDRSNPYDKFTKTILWYLWLPIIGIRCRLKGTQLIWNDETVPFTATILRIFFGRNIAITVMDFFARIYTEGRPHLHWLCNLIEYIDVVSWRKLPLIFTKVLYTQDFLAERGVPREIMHLYRNPVDHAKFHPVERETRQITRKEFGFNDEDIVLSHHGILHPNKGNDWILKQIAELEKDLPNLKFLLIGNGPEMDNLHELADKLNLNSRVVFTGWLPSEEDLNNALASADIGLVMRIGQETDHFHMTDTLAHEMACGKPILAINLKGIAEVINDGENGFLFSTYDKTGFCNRLTSYCASADLRKEHGTKALSSSRKISSIENIANNITSIIKETYV